MGLRVLAEARAIVDAVDALTDSRRWAEPDEAETLAGRCQSAPGVVLGRAVPRQAVAKISNC